MNPYVIPWMDDDLEVFRDTVVRFHRDRDGSARRALA
jgi:hypothetical protein